MRTYVARAVALLGRWLPAVLLGLLLTGAQVHAANRVVSITAPDSAAPDTEISISISMGTDANDGEQIGFLHSDFSIDGGKTWAGFCYAQDLGPSSMQTVTIKTGPAGAKCIVRARVAFRGGKAKDVDFNGMKIDWAGSWEQWKEPPAKYVIFPVASR
jgi:hypothetical protein